MKDKSNKKYWMCIIGGVEENKLPFGADSILRNPVRDAYLKSFGHDDVCASGWGINEDKYELLRTLHTKSNLELSKALEYLKNES